MHYKILAFISIIFLLNNGINAQITKAKITLVENSLLESENSLSDSIKRHNLMERMRLYNVPSVSIAVINHGKIEWAKAYGYADVKEKKLANNKTMYQAASLSKSFNALYIMKLVQEGKLSLETDIRPYLKTWKLQENEFSLGKTITLKNLLSHTAGLGTSGFDGYLQTDSIPTINQILDGQKPANNEAVKTIMPVNTSFKYSGGGTILTRKIIEDNIASNYDSLLLTNILKPLKMKNSTFRQVLTPKFRNFANAYEGGQNEVPGKYSLYPELAPDGLWSTPTDIAKFVISIQQSVSNKKHIILNNSTAVKMLTPVLNTNDIALGVFIIEKGGEKYFVHLGGNRGFQCIYYGSFTTGKGVVVMVNSDNAHPTLIKEIVNSVATVYEWKDFYSPYK